MQSRLIITIAALTIFFSCHKEDHLADISLVESALQPHFRAFEAEAAERGISISAAFANISAEIVDIGDGNVVGECWYNSHSPNEIRIDRSFWRNASELSREHVVFHELGHCYLDRGHSEESTAGGACLSIMASGTGDCRNLYSMATREVYLDELFFGTFGRSE